MHLRGMGDAQLRTGLTAFVLLTKRGNRMNYQELRSDLKTGDILLFSGKGGISDGIKFFTLSKYSHVAMVYRFDDPREWADAGFRDIFAATGLKLAEWPERAASALPVPDLLAFDTDALPIWYPPAATGKAPPSAMSGHSLSVVKDYGSAPGAEYVVCFGGVFRHPPGLQRDPFGVLGKFAHLPAETQCDVGTGARVLEQEALYVHLVGAVDGFEILVDTRRGDDGAHFFLFRWHHHARQFPAVVTGEVGNIGRVICREAEAAHLCGDAQAPVVLHGARVVRAALGVPARYFLVVEHHGLDAMAVEKQCEHQSDRAAAGDRYLSIQDVLSLSVCGEGGAFVATRIAAPGPDRMRRIRYPPQQSLATSGATKPSRDARFTAADRARTCKSPLGGVV